MSSSTMPTSRSVNIGSRLTAMAKRVPDQLAVVMPWNDRRSRPRAGQTRSYRWVTFAELERDSNIVAAGLQRMGVKPGTRIVLLVRPGIEFVMLTFSLFKAGAVTILIDPGMGRQHLLDCLQQARPEGFVAIPLAHIARLLHRKRFPQARYFVTVGRRWGWGGTTLRRLMKGTTDGYRTVSTTAEDPAAIIFTSGSTGPPKGVLYRHGNFDTQVEEIRRRYDIQPGGRDLAGFPLFGLFNSAMGVTTIIPDMDASRPASVDPCKIVEAIEDWQIDQAFASPAVWNAVGRHCVDAKLKLPTLRRVLSAGAPVPTHVLRNLQETIAPDGEIWTPYGATESLPVASISARQVLSETAEKSATGAGTCVGTRFERIQWKVIRISDHPIATLADAEPLSRGQIGELIVRGPVVTTEYVTRTESNAWSKISDGDSFWHRMGDVGYLDEGDRFWFCGRKAHRVQTDGGPMFTIPCEAIFNQHPRVFRSALVGVGTVPHQSPAVVFETWPNATPANDRDRDQLIEELHQLGQRYEHTKVIPREQLFHHPSLPVDVRHNAKIFREQLAMWASEQINGRKG